MARLIDSDELLKRLKLYLNKTSLGEITVQTELSVGEICSLIKDCPTVEAEPVRRGKWVEFGNDIHHCLECFKCGYLQSIYEKRPKYCPDCGAKMEEESENG